MEQFDPHDVLIPEATFVMQRHAKTRNMEYGRDPRLRVVPLYVPVPAAVENIDLGKRVPDWSINPEFSVRHSQHEDSAEDRMIGNRRSRLTSLLRGVPPLRGT
jgi:hypothetical protein